MSSAHSVNILYDILECGVGPEVSEEVFLVKQGVDQVWVVM